ncbi:hypothetical protein TCON_0293 [Astathelohania contejeani]|uniref:Uncharacterized protein n=1 Tax=Astathelohania contejeani TaxID=164912 RepID=A0ABQ7I200_9MICR|nr:hypothetical protein TCON_0293 [Thelohania contejeani]
MYIYTFKISPKFPIIYARDELLLINTTFPLKYPHIEVFHTSSNPSSHTDYLICDVSLTPPDSFQGIIWESTGLEDNIEEIADFIICKTKETKYDIRKRIYEKEENYIDTKMSELYEEGRLLHIKK